MKPLMTLSKTVAALSACLLFSAPLQAAETPTVPVGYVTLKAAAGTGTAKKSTSLSLPLYGTMEGDGAMKGQLTHISANALTNADADWTPGQLSQAAAPSLIKITSGAATGRTFLISTATPNTANTVVIDANDVAQGALNTLGIAIGDSYELLPCDTLSSLLGTPETSGVVGGAKANSSDTVAITTNGKSDTFFYSTTLQRWTKSYPGNPDATNQPLHPDVGFTYSRIASSDLTLLLTGRVATTSRLAAVKNSGVTHLAQNWPINTTLLDTNIHQIAGWQAGESAAKADRAQLYIDGVLHTYWFDGTNWREHATSTPIADSLLIPAGTSVILTKLGTTAGYSPVSQALPYNLE